MIKGATIQVSLRERDSRDAFGNDVEAYAAPVVVDNVLVQPGKCDDLDSTRPDGVRVAFTLHFPKTWNQRMRGAKVTLPAPWAGDYAVISDPTPYMDANCPTQWHMPVEVEAVDG